MAKLFAKEKVVAIESAEKPIASVEENEENLVEVEDAAEDIETVTKATEMSLERLAVMESIKDTMSSKKLCSDDYIATLENYKPIAAKLGIKYLPDLNDFRNKYAAESAHQYATEGFIDVIKSFWEKIKDFFRSFFKKVTIFFKRILKASLDLESYDKYCDQLVAKLVANKATCSDNSPLGSKLPKYLADRGDGKIDSDFILRVGYVKIGKMLDMVETLRSSRDTSILSPTAIKLYERDFVALVEQCKKGYPDPSKTLADIEAIAERGRQLVIGNFKFEASGNQIPEDVQVAINEKFGGMELGPNEPITHSLCDLHGDFNSLPRGTNIFLAEAGNYLYCRGYCQDSQFVDDRVTPISDVHNLASLHKTYKNGIAKLDVRSISKSVDEIANVTDHFLHMLSKNMPELIESVSSKSNSDRAPTDLGEHIITKLLKNKELFKDTADWSALESSVTSVPPDGLDAQSAFVHISTSLTDLTSGLSRNVSSLREAIASNNDLSGRIATVNAMNQEQKNIAWAIFNKTLHSSGDGVQLSPEDMALLKSALSNLGRSLNQMFTQLQLLYKDIATLFYQQITEIRYALIKYIYDSAQRFTY